MKKIISKPSELVKLCHIDRSGPFWGKQCTMYEVDYNSRTSDLSNCEFFYYRFRPGGPLCNAKRDMLGIAKFIVSVCSV